MDAWALTDHGNGNGLAHAHAHAVKMQKSGRKFRQIYGVSFISLHHFNNGKKIIKIIKMLLQQQKQPKMKRKKQKKK